MGGLGLILGEWYRNPLRRQMRAQPIAYRTELYRVRFKLSMTRKYLLEDVWNSLVAAGAVPTSGGPVSGGSVSGGPDEAVPGACATLRSA